MDKHENFSLSICIPTFNRGWALDRCIESIVSQEGFNGEVEIVISDNASTDNTEDVVLKYKNKFPQNIIYCKNPVNIGMEKNIAKVLELANGDYLKLLNDYSIFENGSIEKILTIIAENLNEKSIIYFKNSTSRQVKNNVKIYNLSNFLIKEIEYLTWIGSFGIWKEDLLNITNKDKLVGTMFYHVLIFLESLKSNNDIYCYENKYLISQKLNSKGGYNLFEVFVSNYIGKIITGIYKQRKISLLTLYFVKIEFYKKFITKWIKNIVINKKYQFDKRNWGRIIFKEYKYYPMLYYSSIYLIIYYLGKKITISLKDNAKKNS